MRKNIPLNVTHTPLIHELGDKNLCLITAAMQRGLYAEVKSLLEIDHQLRWLLWQCKMVDSDSRSYIWRTQDDEKVRESHRQNDDRIFSWSKPPETGHPGEDYGCRCWAEPIGGNQYASQMMLTEVDDRKKKWGFVDFASHYYLGRGEEKTLEQIGWMGDVVQFYAERAIAADGKPGIYRRVNQQIINDAIKSGEGSLYYTFGTSYEFGDLVFELAESTVSGEFSGEARIEGNYLVINGVVLYEFFDDFADPFQIVEAIDSIPFVDRQNAIDFLNSIGVDPDTSGFPFPIRASWATKFNATVKITPR